MNISLKQFVKLAELHPLKELKAFFAAKGGLQLGVEHLRVCVCVSLTLRAYWISIKKERNTSYVSVD